LLSPAGEPIERRARLIGRATAGEAEYRAILLGLKLAQRHGADPLEVRSDSQLAIAALQRETASESALVRDIRAQARGIGAVRCAPSSTKTCGVTWAPSARATSCDSSCRYGNGQSWSRTKRRMWSRESAG